MFEAYCPYTGEWFVGDTINDINKKLSKIYNEYVSVIENDEGSLIVDYDVSRLAKECDFVTCIIAARCLINSQEWNGNVKIFQRALIESKTDNLISDIAQSPYWDGDISYFDFSVNIDYSPLSQSPYWNGYLNIKLSSNIELAKRFLENPKWNGGIVYSELMEYCPYRLKQLIIHIVNHKKWNGVSDAIYLYVDVDKDLEDLMEKHPNYK